MIFSPKTFELVGPLTVGMFGLDSVLIAGLDAISGVDTEHTPKCMRRAKLKLVGNYLIPKEFKKIPTKNLYSFQELWPQTTEFGSVVEQLKRRSSLAK
jgi:hypothetical protein